MVDFSLPSLDPPLEPFDNKGIAERLRAVLGAAPIEELALKLGVDLPGLRLSLDEASPHPTVEVIVAVATTLAIDPTWLLTGEYNPATHRQVTDTAAEAAQAVESVIARRSTGIRVLKELG